MWCDCVCKENNFPPFWWSELSVIWPWEYIHTSELRALRGFPCCIPLFAYLKEPLKYKFLILHTLLGFIICSHEITIIFMWSKAHDVWVLDVVLENHRLSCGSVVCNNMLVLSFLECCELLLGSLKWFSGCWCENFCIVICMDKRFYVFNLFSAMWLQVDATKRGGIARFINHSCEVVLFLVWKQLKIILL